MLVAQVGKVHTVNTALRAMPFTYLKVGAAVLRATVNYEIGGHSSVFAT